MGTPDTHAVRLPREGGYGQTRQQDFITSAGFGILIDLMSQSRHSDATLRIAHPSDHFRKIFELVGLSQHVPVLGSVEEARRDF